MNRTRRSASECSSGCWQAAVILASRVFSCLSFAASFAKIGSSKTKTITSIKSQSTFPSTRYDTVSNLLRQTVPFLLRSTYHKKQKTEVLHMRREVHDDNNKLASV